MKRFLMVIILLAFPVTEAWILLLLAQKYSWWVLFYLVTMGFLGALLIRQEKLLVSGRIMQSLMHGGNPLKTMLGSARNVLAGILLIIPGVISDVMAVCILLFPIRKTATSSVSPQAKPYNQSGMEYRSIKTHAANDEVIEGEFVSVKEKEDEKDV